MSTTEQMLRVVSPVEGAGGEQRFGPWTKKSRGLIYFIQVDTHGSAPVKIGWAKVPAQRLAALQIGNPDQLVLLGSFAGTVREERRLHWWFEADRIRGEWYRYSAAIFELATGHSVIGDLDFTDYEPLEQERDRLYGTG